jgi:two-component system sensor kinase FixL
MNHTTRLEARAEPQTDPAPAAGAMEPASEARPAPDRPARMPRTFALRSYLIAMALAVMLPMGLLGGVAIHAVIREYQAAYQERLRATARLLGNALDSAIQMRKTAIMALADSPLMENPGSLDFYNYANQIGTGLGAWVTVKTPDRVLATTFFPYGARLPRPLLPWDPSTVGEYHVTDLQRVNGLAAPFVSVTGPVLRDGHVIAMISIPFAYEQLGRRLADGLFTSDGVLCLMDGNGALIALSRSLERFIGHRSPDWMIALAASPEPAIGFGRLLDGGDVIVSTAHPSEAPGWTVVVAQPVAGYYNEWIYPLVVTGGGGLVLLLALLLLVNRFAVWLVRPLGILTQNARIVAGGRWERLPAAHHASRVIEFETLRISLNAAAQVMDGRAEAIRVAFASARRERNLLHSVVNGNSDPTFVRDADGRIVLANAAGLAMYGEPAGNFVGKVCYRPGLSRTEAECREEDRRVYASGATVPIERTYEVDGRRRSFIGAKSPWRSASGVVLGVVTIIHDITDWKRSENRLRELQAELIRTGRLSAMGAMANGLAHELNQPLAAITNYLGAARRLIAQAPATQLPAARPAGDMSLGVASGAIEDACTQAMRAGEIVSRMREFIGRGVAAMRIETINDMVADACALALPQDTRGRVSLRVAFDADLAPVIADRLQIEQVLVNLVLNAVQSMADSPRQELTITAGRDAAGDTRIRVSDTGPGIPEEMLSEVFEPFVTTRPDGLGLGLAIARMIVAAHGGTLVASNNAGGGATLTLILPAVLSMETADA